MHFSSPLGMSVLALWLIAMIAGRLIGYSVDLSITTEE
jgi:hypothetical protein